MNHRLTRVEALPESAIEDVQWLFDITVANRMNQTDMLDEMNRRLSRRGIEPLSLSGLNRYVMRVRSGDIRRPALQAVASSEPSGIFTSTFRDRLVASIGEAAVRAQEAALTALIKP